MPAHGTIIVIKRNGSDGSHFRVTSPSCMIGRDLDCDIRIQLPNVSKFHCRIYVGEDGEIMIRNLSDVNPTKLNGTALHGSSRLQHSDVFELVDRCFRWESCPLSSPEGSPSTTSHGTAPTPNRTSFAPVNNRNLSKTPTNADATTDGRWSLSHLDTMAAKRVSFDPTALSQRPSTSSSRVTTPTAFLPSSTAKTGISFHSPAAKYFGSPMIDMPGQLLSGSAAARRSAPVDTIPEEAPESPSTTPARGRPPSKSPGVSGSRKRSRSGDSNLADKHLRSAEIEENWEKIVSPASPDSKKLAALRTIHAAKLRESAAVSPEKAKKESKQASKGKTPAKRNLLSVALASPVVKARKVGAFYGAGRQKAAVSPAKKVSVHSLSAARYAKKASPVTTPVRKSVEKLSPVAQLKGTRGNGSPKSPAPARSLRLSRTPAATVTPKSSGASPTRYAPAVSPRTPLSRRYSTPASRRKSLVPSSKRKSVAHIPAPRTSINVVSPDLRTKALLASAAKWDTPRPGSALTKTRSTRNSSPRGQLSQGLNASTSVPDTPSLGSKRGRPSLRSVSASSSPVADKKRGRSSIGSSGSASTSSGKKKRGRPSHSSSPDVSPEYSPVSVKLGRPSLHTLTSVSSVNTPTFSERSFSSPSTLDSTFDSNQYRTPSCPRDQFVSPLTASKTESSPPFALERMMNRRSITSPATVRAGRKSAATSDCSIRHSSVGSRRSSVVVSSPASLINKSGASVPPPRKKSSPGPGYTDVFGLKRLMRSPVKSPQADYTQVGGVKRLMRSAQKSPNQGLDNVFGLKRLMRSPVKSPQADYTQVGGVKRLMRGAQKSPNQGYADVSGVEWLLASKSPNVEKQITKRSVDATIQPIKVSPIYSAKVVSSASKSTTPDTSALQVFRTPARSARATRSRVEVVDPNNDKESLPATRPKTSAKKAPSTSKKTVSPHDDDDVTAKRASRSASKVSLRESRSSTRSTPRGAAYQLQVTPLSATKRSLSPLKGNFKKRVESPAITSLDETLLIGKRSVSPVKNQMANKKINSPQKPSTPPHKTLASPSRRLASPVKNLITPNTTVNKPIISSLKQMSPLTKTPLSTRRSSSPAKNLPSNLKITPLGVKNLSPDKSKGTPGSAHKLNASYLSSPIDKLSPHVASLRTSSKSISSSPTIASPKSSPASNQATARSTRRKAKVVTPLELSPVVRTLRKRQATSATSVVKGKRSSKKTVDSLVRSSTASATTARGRGTRLAKRDLTTPKAIVEEKETEIEREVSIVKPVRGRKKAVVADLPLEQVLNNENATVIEPSPKKRRGATRGAAAAKPLADAESPRRSTSPLKPVIEGNTPILPPKKRTTRRAVVTAENSPPEKTAVKRGRSAIKKPIALVVSPLPTTPDENAVPQSTVSKKAAGRDKKTGAVVKGVKLSEVENSPPKKLTKGRSRQVVSPLATPLKSPTAKPTKSLRSRKVGKTSPLKVKSPSPKKSPVKRTTRSTRR